MEGKASRPFPKLDIFHNEFFASSLKQFLLSIHDDAVGEGVFPLKLVTRYFFHLQPTPTNVNIESRVRCSIVVFARYFYAFIEETWLVLFFLFYDFIHEDFLKFIHEPNVQKKLDILVPT